MIKGMRLFIFILCVFLTACADQSHTHENEKNHSTVINSTPNTKVDSIIHKEPIKPKEPDFTRLTSRNSLAYLSEFSQTNASKRIKICTKHGDMEFILYKGTPLHAASFIHLIQEKYFSGVEITRVLKNHVIQGGNSQKKSKSTQRFLLGKYTVPHEIRPYYIHKKGALALARQMENNPDKDSEPYDFYIVHGRKIGSAELYNIQKEKDITYSDKQKEIYKTKGGTPHLDGEFTVFGEITSGLSILEKLADLPVDKQNWPKDNLLISIEIID
ncbi:MAG: peptidyl-prolyl cis-trans isomerase A (cyclophilin A) [Flavobacteriales bacterium]